jgi:PAS domain S-box-containing protein
VLLEHAVRLLGASGGAVCVRGEDGALEEFEAAGAGADGPTEPGAVARASARALASVGGDGLWLLRPEAIARRRPDLAGAARAEGVQAIVAVPLGGARRPVGALALAFRGARRLAPRDRALLTALCDAGALALERAQLSAAIDPLRARSEAAAAQRLEVETLRMLVGQVKDYAIFMLDPQGIVRTWNRGAERIKGYRADEVVGTNFARFYPEEDVRAGKPVRELAAAAKEGRFEDEGFRVRKDGSTFWANVIITALRDPDGALRGFGKVTRDVTDRVRAEQERLRLARAEEATRARDQFLGIASHEFRTPITALGLNTQVLLRLGERTADVSLASVTARLRAIHDQSMRLAGLVQALFDVTQVTAGHLALRREPIDLTAVVRAAMARWRDALVRAGCALDLRVERSISGEWDRARLEQVIDHLVANAVKFGAGHPVEVEVTAEHEGAEAHLTVSDHGIGMSAEDQRRIFERFERAVPIRHYGGFGLGLWLVRNIVEAHGGGVSVWSEPGKGSRFDVTLPAQRMA